MTVCRAVIWTITQSLLERLHLVSFYLHGAYILTGIAHCWDLHYLALLAEKVGKDEMLPASGGFGETSHHSLHS